ncbi:fimbrial protein [Paramixta manurensis]|uniref:Fimbrial protein n=1 Tax=Paramixta manurensis TaxID=2740817 RepID=A0A6M8ULA9_9GAMM|nr:fimbrial protein [Erwiniaceae bacterium PD-1]
MKFVTGKIMRSRPVILIFLMIFYLAGPAAYAASVIKCGSDSNTSNSINAFDFDLLPNQIPDTVPVGTTIYDTTMDLELWCAKAPGSIGSGEEKIYVNREPIQGTLGSKSGLSFFITINGERSDQRKTYDSGYTTSAIFLQGLATSYYTKIKVPVRIELVKTGENVQLNPAANYIFLFSVGDQGRGELLYRAININKLGFSSFTCNTLNTDIHRTLPVLNLANINGITGRIDGYADDFSIRLNCNGELWSTLSINMAFNGAMIPGLESQGVYLFTSANDGGVAKGIGFQLLHKDASDQYVTSGKGEWFKVGNFTSGLNTLDVPVRAVYYKTAEQSSPGKLTGIVTFTIDYQ